MQVDGRKKESCGETLGTEGQAQVGSRSWGRKRQGQEREAFLVCGHDSDNADRAEDRLAGTSMLEWLGGGPGQGCLEERGQGTRELAVLLSCPEEKSGRQHWPFVHTQCPSPTCFWAGLSTSACSPGSARTHQKS